jgi:sulfite reductase (ferredoxin)
MVERGDLVEEVRPLLEHFKSSRVNGESFSDFWNRVGLEELEEISA